MERAMPKKRTLVKSARSSLSLLAIVRAVRWQARNEASVSKVSKAGI